MVWEFIPSIGVWSSGIMSTDEKHTRVKGSKHWVYMVADITTKFVFGWDVSPLKIDGYDARGLFARALGIAGLPTILISDVLRGFKFAFKGIGNFAGSGPIKIQIRESTQQSVPVSTTKLHLDHDLGIFYVLLILRLVSIP